MIISDKIDVTITNQGKYWSSLGYGAHKQGTTISVFVKDLPENSNKKVECKCDDCGNAWWATYQSLHKQKDHHRCFDCTRIYIGKTMNTENISIANSMRLGSLHHRWNPDKKAFHAYAYKVRQITEQNYTKYKEQINPDSHPRTKCGIEGGYQLDHKISVKWGFTHGANPKFIGSLDNLQMLSWKDNLLKGE